MGSRKLARVTDAKLVRLAQDGDVRAFEELYGRHQPAVLSFCRHLTGRLEDAEDAVQHTFLGAYFAITGDGPELDIKPWLFTVARNRCISLLRSRRVREPQPALRTAAHPLPPVDEAPADAWGTDGLAEEVERREDLRELVADLGELPEPQRAALVLSELEALSHAQIAQVLDVAPAKVRALVFQARSSLLSTREARDTPCGEIRMQISTLCGSSLRRRTLRRHVRACPGCRDFEAAVRMQRHDLALILPVVAASTMRDGLPSGLAGGAAGSGAAGNGAGGSGAAASGSSGGGAAGGGLAAGGSSGGGAVGGGLAGSGAAAVGAGAAAGGGAAVGGGGLLSGIVAAVAGGGAVQLTAVVAVAAAGTVGAMKADAPQRLGITGAIGPEHAQVRQERDHRAEYGRRILATTDVSGGSGRQLGARAGDGDGGVEAGGRGGSPNRPGAGKPADASQRRPSTPPGLAGRDGDVPPGLANRDGGMAPGLAKKDGETPPGWDRRGDGNGNGGNGNSGNGNGNGGNGGGGNGNGGAKPRNTPPGQSNESHPNGTPPGQSKDSQPGSQAPKSAPPGQSNGTPPGQSQKEDSSSSAAPSAPPAADKPGNSEKAGKPK